ncbi:UNVERIFIED_CONTAM: hypothetical protein Sradi_6978600 [Sesamum radiatum]|uniref:Uncharacterized protein n=1 Tax=Sesamum radiatum TaxID=300843 RepID=A0AAW2JDM5_SESRA
MDRARRPPMVTGSLGQSNWIALKLREGNPLDGLKHPARRSRAQATRELAGLPANKLARCELARSQAGPDHQVVSSPADSWRRKCWIFKEGKLTCKNSFWKGFCKSLLIWNEDYITL